jgi:hypothetical protein
MKFFSYTKKYILHQNITGKIIWIFVQKPSPVQPRYNISMSVYGGSSSCELEVRHVTSFFSIEHTRALSVLFQLLWLLQTLLLLQKSVILA